MSFQDIIFILKNESKKELNEFIDNSPYYISAEQFFKFVEYLFYTKEEKLITNFKENKKTYFLIFQLEEKYLNIN